MKKTLIPLLTPPESSQTAAALWIWRSNRRTAGSIPAGTAPARRWSRRLRSARRPASASTGEISLAEPVVCLSSLLHIVLWMSLVYVPLTVSFSVWGVTCPKGLVYEECRDKLDDFCYGGSVTSAHIVLDIIVTGYLIVLPLLFLLFSLSWRLLHPRASLDSKSSGCFCPSGQFREGNHSHTCVSQCPCE